MTDPFSFDAMRAQWDSGDAMRVGWTTYEALSDQGRVQLAAELLATSCQLLPAVPPAIGRVLSIAQDGSRWREAHEAFRGVRALTLKHASRDRPDRIYEAALYVAENAAKVIYNASHEPAPFDYDAGYWLVGCAHTLAMVSGEPELKDKFWAVVVAVLQSTGRPP